MFKTHKTLKLYTGKLDQWPKHDMQVVFLNSFKKVKYSVQKSLPQSPFYKEICCFNRKLDGIEGGMKWVSL